MGQRPERPEQRTCTSCSQAFVANWPQRLCYRCKRRRHLNLYARSAEDERTRQAIADAALADTVQRRRLAR